MDKPARSPLLLPRAAHACREPLRRKDEAPWHSPTADGQLSGGLSTAGSPPLWIVGRRPRPARLVAAALAPWLPQARLSRPGCRLDDRLPHQGVGRPRLEVGDEPGGGLAGDLLQRAGLLEQVAGASHDLQPVGRCQPFRGRISRTSSRSRNTWPRRLATRGRPMRGAPRACFHGFAAFASRPSGISAVGCSAASTAPC